MSKGLYRTGIVAPVALAAIAAACSAAPSGDRTESTTEGVSGSCATPVVVDQSLFVASVDGQNNPNPLGVAALKDFTFQAVMDQIIATGATGSTQTALELYDQLLDTLNKAPGDTNGPHCTGTINGFAVDCPRPEGILATTNPFTGTKGDDILTPVALVNRFDLAPSNGANCGQYRVVFAINPAKLSPPVARFLMIFEAVLPNPVPSSGLAACLPVAQFWDNLSATGITKASFAKQLKSFYFDGLPGVGGAPPFAPVISAANYGIGSPKNKNTGQIRVNMLSSEQWQLREFRLSQDCTGGVCTLTGNNTFVQDNPFGALFATGGSPTFQSEFIKQVKPLSADTIPLISMTTPNVDNAGQSSEQDSTNDYEFQGKGNSKLIAAIQTELTALGSALTPTDILNRATTQSCAGCHQLSPGKDLGGKLTWPLSNGFTQVEEGGQQSTALTKSFLPFRQTVLTNFINGHCGGGGTDDGDGTLTVGGEQVGSSN
jgi:hypothetical protein